MGDMKLNTTLINNVYEEHKSHFKSWVAKQPLPVEALIVAGIHALKHAPIGFFADIIVNGYPSSFDPQSFRVPGGYQPLVNSFLGGGPISMARNFAVRTGVNKGVRIVMEKIRGKQDLYSEFVAGFSSGVMLSLVTGMKGPSVVSLGVTFALVNIGFLKVGEKSARDKLSRSPAKEVWDEVKKNDNEA